MTNIRVSRYFSFRGRAPRAEIWKVVLIVSFLPLIPIAVLMGVFSAISVSGVSEAQVDAIMLFATLPFYPIFITAIVRRLHDLNWSGYWLLLVFGELIVFELGHAIYERSGKFFWWMWVFVPPLICCHLVVLYGFLALFIGLGTRGPNKYGPDPVKG